MTRLDDAKRFKNARKSIEKSADMLSKLQMRLQYIFATQTISAQKGEYEKGKVLEAAQDLLALAHRVVTQADVMDATHKALGPEEVP